MRGARPLLLPVLGASLLLLSRASLGAPRSPAWEGDVGESGPSLRPGGEDRAPRRPRPAPSPPAPGHGDGAAAAVRSLIRAGRARELRRRLTQRSERTKRVLWFIGLGVYFFVGLILRIAQDWSRSGK